MSAKKSIGAFSARYCISDLQSPSVSFSYINAHYLLVFCSVVLLGAIQQIHDQDVTIL